MWTHGCTYDLRFLTLISINYIKCIDDIGESDLLKYGMLYVCKLLC